MLDLEFVFDNVVENIIILYVVVFFNMGKMKYDFIGIYVVYIKFNFKFNWKGYFYIFDFDVILFLMFYNFGFFVFYFKICIFCILCCLFWFSGENWFVLYLNKFGCLILVFLVFGYGKMIFFYFIYICRYMR